MSRTLFSLGFPVACCLILSLIERNVEASNFECSHIPPTRDQIQFARIGSRHSIRKREASFQRLRIKHFYDESISKITREQFVIINDTILPTAINYWQDALFVRPLALRMKLARKCTNNSDLSMVSEDTDIDSDSQFCSEDCESETLCGEVIIPSEHLQSCRVCKSASRGECREHASNGKADGVEADFILYISTMQTNRCYRGSTIAYAAHCQQEASFYRPIAGHANICPDAISTKPQDLETLISTFKHEILHALGFSVSLYPYYRYQSHQNHLNTSKAFLLPSQISLSNNQQFVNILRMVDRPQWRVRGGLTNHSVYVIATPNVVREVRVHFNCSRLEGAELENQGEDGTCLTHWEKRLFENEAMTGTHTQNPVYSRITLALMEDTGWFKVNYSLAQNLKWGKNLGCDFAMKSCTEWIETKRAAGESIHPFCDRVRKDPLQTECMDDRDSVALCNLKRYDQALEDKYQNFEHIPHVDNESLPFYGGAVALSDYCPYIQEFTWKAKEVVVRGSECFFTENNPTKDKNFALESYGPRSKCFEHGEEMWEEKTCLQDRQWQHWGSGCYRFDCRDGLLHLIIQNNITFTCFEERQKLNIQLFYNGWLHNGTIVCPKCSELCSTCRNLSSTELKAKRAKYRETRHHLKCTSTMLDSYFTLSCLFAVITLKLFF